MVMLATVLRRTARLVASVLMKVGSCGGGRNDVCLRVSDVEGLEGSHHHSLLLWRKAAE